MLKLNVPIPPSCCLSPAQPTAGPCIPASQPGPSRFPLLSRPVVEPYRPRPRPRHSPGYCASTNVLNRCRLSYSGWCPPRSLRLPTEDCACPSQPYPRGEGSHPQNKAIKGTEYFLFLSGLIRGAAGYWRIAPFFLETNLRLPKLHYSGFDFLIPKTIVWICGSIKRRPPPPLTHSPGQAARAEPCASSSRLSHWLELGHGPAPSAVFHWPNVGQGPASHEKAGQLHALGPLLYPGPGRIHGSHWLSVWRGRDAIGPHFQPEGGTRLGCMAQETGGAGRARAGAERRGARCGVGCFGLAFFFSAKEVCFGHASRLPPPPAPSPAPLRSPLGADCKAPSVERAADFARARLAHLVEGAP